MTKRRREGKASVWPASFSPWPLLVEHTAEGGGVRRRRASKFDLNIDQTERERKKKNPMLQKRVKDADWYRQTQEPVFSGRRDDDSGWTQVLPVDTKEILSCLVF